MTLSVFIESMEVKYELPPAAGYTIMFLMAAYSGHIQGSFYGIAVLRITHSPSKPTFTVMGERQYLSMGQAHNLKTGYPSGHRRPFHKKSVTGKTAIYYAVNPFTFQLSHTSIQIPADRMRILLLLYL